MSLEDKLEEMLGILPNEVNDATKKYMVAEIIQCFKDEGYRQLPVKVGPDDNLWLCFKEPLSGQEFYDRFVEALKAPDLRSRFYQNKFSRILDAARIAAGLDGDNLTKEGS